MLDPKDIHERLVTLGTEWAEENAAAELLEETKKTLIAELMNECNEKSSNAKETYALRQRRYLDHIEGMVAARKAANKSKVRYDSAKVWAELKRTEAANERAANRSAI